MVSSKLKNTSLKVSHVCPGGRHCSALGTKFLSANITLIKRGQELAFFAYPVRTWKGDQGHGLNSTEGFVFALCMDSVVLNIFNIFYSIAVIILFHAQIVPSLATETGVL